MGWYIDEKSEPLFPFGFGLSYTTFEYANLRVFPPHASASSGVTVIAQITNTGSRAGEEVAQVYVEDLVCSFATPIRRLVAFRRIALQPRQTQTIEFQLDASAFTALDQSLESRIEPGEFKISVGRNFTTDALSGSVTIAP